MFSINWTKEHLSVIRILDLDNDYQFGKGKMIPALRGNISFYGLKFLYGNRLIFNNLNLTVNSGEKIAFVGESGSGKSTLIKLLAGLLKPGGGKILVDDYDLSRIDLNSYYDYIDYVPKSRLSLMEL